MARDAHQASCVVRSRTRELLEMLVGKFQLRRHVPILSFRCEETAMRALRENLFPVAFLALWLGVSGYTLYAMRGLRALRVVERTVSFTVTSSSPGMRHVATTSEADR